MYIRTDDNIYEGTGVKIIEGSEILYEAKLDDCITYIPATEVNMTCDNINSLIDEYYIIDNYANSIIAIYDDLDDAFEMFKINPRQFDLVGAIIDKNNSKYIVIKFLRDRNFVFTQ